VKETKPVVIENDGAEKEKTELLDKKEEK